MRAEELLAVLEQGGQESETLNHLREINAHVTSLILEAPELRQETAPTTAGSQSRSNPHQHQTRPHPALPTHGRQYHPPRTTQSPPVTSPHDPRVPMVPHTPFPPHTNRRLALKSSSMSEVRSQPVPSDPPPSSSRRKSRRFLSLKGGIESTDRPYYPPSPQQYPLRETFSMQGLPTQSTHSNYPTSHPPFRGRAASMTIPTNNYPHSPSSPTNHQHTSTEREDLSASYPPPHPHRTQPRPAQPTATRQEVYYRSGTSTTRTVSDY